MKAARVLVAAAAVLLAAPADAREGGGPLQPNDAVAARLHRQAAAAHTKEIYGEMDFARLCAPDGPYRKRVSSEDGKTEVCLRRWAVLVMPDDAKARLVEEVSGTAKVGAPSVSSGTFAAAVCTDLGWKHDGTDAAPCPDDVKEHYIEPGMAPSVRARFVVENRRPLRVHWDNAEIFDAAKPDIGAVGRDVVTSHERAKLALETVRSQLRELVAEQQLFLGPLLRQMYQKVPEGQRPTDVEGRPFQDLPPQVGFEIRRDFVQAATKMINEKTSGKVTQIEALLEHLEGIDRTPHLKGRHALQARDLAAQVDALTGALSKAIGSYDRSNIAEALNLMATESLYKHLGLDHGAGGPTEAAMPAAAEMAGRDELNIEKQVDQEMGRPINQLSSDKAGVEPDMAAVDERLAKLAAQDTTN